MFFKDCILHTIFPIQRHLPPHNIPYPATPTPQTCKQTTLDAQMDQGRYSNIVPAFSSVRGFIVRVSIVFPFSLIIRSMFSF